MERKRKFGVVFLLMGLSLVGVMVPLFQRNTLRDQGVQVYLYGLPLIVMDITEQLMTNVSSPKQNGHAPFNTFSHAPVTPDDTFTDVVRPNVDTLYSSAWLDLAHEPLVLQVPDTHDRFYLLTFYDMYTNIVTMIGKPTTGTAAGRFLITGPGWSGATPDGMTHIPMPHDHIWIIGRTQDRALQLQYTLTPLSVFLGVSTEPAQAVEMSTQSSQKAQSPLNQVMALDGEEFFTRLMRLMARYKPSDAPILEQMRMLGLVPSADFNFAQLDKSVQHALRGVPRRALSTLYRAAQQIGIQENGWRVVRTNSAATNTNYMQRAIVALLGLGILPPQIALYPTTGFDSKRRRLSGSHNYRIHFEPNQLPPVDAFWSLTLYDSKGFLTSNALKRYSLGGHDLLRKNADGSVDLYIQHRSPGADKEANWLPAPSGRFSLTFRFYMPRKEIVSGAWQLPAVRRS